MSESGFKKFIKRVGVIGFLFFFAKGLLWLAAAGVAAYVIR